MKHLTLPQGVTVVLSPEAAQALSERIDGMDLGQHTDAIRQAVAIGLDGQKQTLTRIPPCPVPMVFGFFSQYGQDYMWIVPKQQWETEHCLDDSSPLSSAARILTGKSWEEMDDDGWDAAEARIEDWFEAATRGIVLGEAMESTYEYVGTQDEARAALEANGLECVDMSDFDS